MCIQDSHIAITTSISGRKVPLLITGRFDLLEVGIPFPHVSKQLLLVDGSTTVEWLDMS